MEIIYNDPPRFSDSDRPDVHLYYRRRKEKVMRRTIYKIMSFRTGWGIQRRFPVIKKIKEFVISTFKTNHAIVHGHEMDLGDDPLILSWQEAYEPETLKIIETYLTEGDIVFDIGANIGYYTLLFAKLVGPKGRVIAFEPYLPSAGILWKNVYRNGYLDRVQVKVLAVSYKTGPTQLYLHPTSSGGHSLRHLGKTNVCDVAGVRLDDFDYPLPNLIKMDIEGTELHALRGMEKFLQRPSVKLIVEYRPEFQQDYVGSKTRLLEYLGRSGFVYLQCDGNLFCRRPG